MMMLRNNLLAFCIILNFGAFVTSSSSSKVTNYWAPKELGTFYLKDVGFIDVYETHPEAENYSERFTAYFTTFNPCKFLVLFFFRINELFRLYYSCKKKP